MTAPNSKLPYLMVGRVAFIWLACIVLGGCAAGGSGRSASGGGEAHRSVTSSNERGYYKVGQPYEIDGVIYTPAEDWNYDETGIASWYGPDFHGKRTANGELYDMNQVTAAHKTLPMPSLVRVTNLENGRMIVVRVNDRGPYSRGRIIDMSRRAAQLLGFEQGGTAKVRVQIMARESQALADAARNGQLAVDIAGIDPDQPPPPPPNTPQYTRAPAPARTASSQTAPGPTIASVAARPPDVAVVDEQSVMRRDDPGEVVKGEDIGGRFLPAPQVSATQKVRPSSIYIQAGAFSVAENAERLRTRLGQVAKTDISPAMVGGRTFYRVRIGPIATVDQADQLLARIVGAGAGDAKIIVD
jgi:rare lipoprotein A